MAAEETFLYFGFGSNLLRQRLQLMNPSARFKTVGELKDYKLHFSTFGNDPSHLRWRGGAATIQSHPGASVWGCVWTMHVSDLESLDLQEGEYKAISVEVQAEGSTLTCRVYQLPASSMEMDPSFDNRPSPQYLDVIVRGAQQNSLPEDYIRSLQNIETNGHSDTVPIYEEVLQSLSSPSA